MIRLSAITVAVAAVTELIDLGLRAAVIVGAAGASVLACAAPPGVPGCAGVGTRGARVGSV